MSDGVPSRSEWFEHVTKGAAGFATSSVLFAVAQVLPAAHWIALVSLVPWLLTLRGASLRAGALSGLAFGTLSGAFCAYWIPEGLEALGATPLHATAGWLFVALWGAGLPWAVVGFGIVALRGQARLRGVLSAMAIVFLVDTARSSLPGELPWVLVGHTQADVPGVAQLAVIGGVPLISALVLGINAALAQLIGGWQSASGMGRAPFAALIGAYLAALVGGEAAVHWARDRALESFEAVRLLLVQPNIPASERWASAVQRTNLALVGRQTEAALREGAHAPDLILWPETVLTDPVDANPELAHALQRWIDHLGLPVVLGAARAGTGGDPGRYLNSVLWMEPGTGVLASFDKTRPIPVVEGAALFPGASELAWLMGVAGRRESIEAAHDNHPLRGRSELAPVLCFEALFPGLVAARRTPKTLAILNLANDSWFAGPLPSRQQVAYLSFRAIEQRLWAIRAAHGGISALIDPYGRVRASLPFGEKGVLRGEITASAPPTRRERVALAGLAGGGALAGLFSLSLMQRRRP